MDSSCCLPACSESTSCEAAESATRSRRVGPCAAVECAAIVLASDPSTDEACRSGASAAVSLCSGAGSGEAFSLLQKMQSSSTLLIERFSRGVSQVPTEGSMPCVHAELAASAAVCGRAVRWAVSAPIGNPGTCSRKDHADSLAGQGRPLVPGTPCNTGTPRPIQLCHSLPLLQRCKKGRVACAARYRSPPSASRLRHCLLVGCQQSRVRQKTLRSDSPGNAIEVLAARDRTKPGGRGRTLCSVGWRPQSLP